jgi:pimeloyl-[acyl-carrier protein] synthase
MLKKALPAHVPHPFSPAGKVNPYPAYAWFRENDPVHFERYSGWWLAVSHAGCSAALANPCFSASLGQRERTRADDLPASMLTSDPPAHARLRGPGALLLGPAALRAQADGCRDAVCEVLDRLDGRDEADASADIGEPFAVGIFTRLFALDAGQAAAFASLARRVSANLDPMGGPEAGAAGLAAAAEFSQFMDRHVQALQEAGIDSPLTRLAADSRLTRTEMLGILTLCVVGGFLPLADLTSHAVHWLADAPESFASYGKKIPEDPGVGRAGGVVDELMRLATPIPFAARVTREPVELDDTLLPAGARVLVVIAAANRDPEVFGRPDEFDADRSPNPHLAFGGGPHLCLGAPLVRWAGGALLRELATRYPGLRQVGKARWDDALVPRRLVGQRLALR